MEIVFHANTKKNLDLRLEKIINHAIFWPAVGFGQNVKRAREAAGYRFANEFAKALKVKPSVVSRWETNKGGLPETPTLLRIAKVTNCSIEDLLVGVDRAYDAQRETARALQTNQPQELIAGQSDPDVLLRILTQWREASSQAHLAALTVLQAYPLQPTAPPQPVTPPLAPSAAENDPRANSNHEKKQGA